MLIALDFDRVIHDTDHPKPGRRMGEPMPGALEGVRQLIREGHEVFVHSTMAQNDAGYGAIEDWLKWYDFPALRIEEKPTADVYVDDLAYEFTSWKFVAADLYDLSLEL